MEVSMTMMGGLLGEGKKHGINCIVLKSECKNRMMYVE